jgi:hypothetical protein
VGGGDGGSRTRGRGAGARGGARAVPRAGVRGADGTTGGGTRTTATLTATATTANTATTARRTTPTTTSCCSRCSRCSRCSCCSCCSCCCCSTCCSGGHCWTATVGFIEEDEEASEGLVPVRVVGLQEHEGDEFPRVHRAFHLCLEARELFRVVVLPHERLH